MFSPTTTPQSVLIVDPSADTRQVLRTVLSRRGVQILESDEGTAGLALARQHHPDVIVFDTDAENATRELWAEYADQVKIDETSLLVLGTAAPTTRRGVRIRRQTLSIWPADS